MEDKRWSNLPDHIVVQVLSYLPMGDRLRAALTCVNWCHCFQSPYLWTRFRFRFYHPDQARLLKALELYGQHLRHVYIELDQGIVVNRENACKVIEGLYRLEERRYKSLRIIFTGENPYFYAGQEFVNSLMILFGPPMKDAAVKSLTEVDLSGLTVAYDDRLFDNLSANHKQLQKLNIQNRVLVCKVSPTCVLRLVQRCRQLQDLRAFHCSVTDDVLLAFTEEDRAPLKYLSMKCRREEKYIKDTTSATWSHLVRKLPELRVGLTFDHTCPLLKVSEVLKPEIPVRDLRLETWIYICEDVCLAPESYYRNTLEKLVLQTPLGRPSPQLDRALIGLATRCPRLATLHVFSILAQETVDEILRLHPEMAEGQTYTLRFTPDAHPWVAGRDCSP